MFSRFVDPEVKVLPLSGGDTITVKRRLNWGEQNDAHARMYRPGIDGALRVDAFKVGIAIVSAYLVDWTLRDKHGEIVPLRDANGRPFPLDEIEMTLRSLDPDSFLELKEAIERHDAETRAARAEEKKRRDGSLDAKPISPSPSGVDGASSGFAPSTLTTITPSSIS
jgi:hypothetical protein